jgi:hypothetical protein
MNFLNVIAKKIKTRKGNSLLPTYFLILKNDFLITYIVNGHNKLLKKIIQTY